MGINKQSVSEAFGRVATRLVDLHHLIAAGKDDASEADDLRDAIDLDLAIMTDVEREQARWLSEDLYSLSEPLPDPATVVMTEKEQRLFAAAMVAKSHRDWDRALELLRQVQESVSPSIISSIRASIWRQFGYPQVAVEFYHHAMLLEPENEDCRVLHFLALEESDRPAARKLAHEILNRETETPLSILVPAASTVLLEIEDFSISEQEPARRKLLAILESYRQVAPPDGVVAKDEASVRAELIELIGWCHAGLNNFDSAIEVCNEGVKEFPNRPTLLTQRGMLLYGQSPQAISDFRKAIELGCSFVWPYLFLAHDALERRSYPECHELCEMGLRCGGSEFASSKLVEWRAIAEAELGFSRDFVRTDFDAAIQADQSNESARRNRDVFESSTQSGDTSSPRAWERPSKTTIRQMGVMRGPREFAV